MVQLVAGSSAAVASQVRQVPAASPSLAWPRRPAVLSTFGMSSLLWRGRRTPPPNAALHGHGANKAGRTVKISRRRSPNHHSGGGGSLVAVPIDSPPSRRGLSSSDGPEEQQDSAIARTNALAFGWWDSLPSRYRIIIGTAMSFVICNLDKVNLSVCIIPMARDYGWSPTVAGLVQSSFFWGYMLCQLPGGYFNSKLGGRRILPAGVLLYSAATAVVPWVAGTVPGLCASRAFVGFGQAASPSAATDMVARAVPPSERARAVTFIFSGFHVGSILGLLTAPWLIAHAGWRSVFVTFGALGFLWWFFFEQGIMSRIEEEEPEFASRLVADSRRLVPITESAAAHGSSSNSSGGGSSAVAVAAPSAAAVAAAAAAEPPPLPWRAFLRSTPIRALAYTHFANNWFHYTMLAWLPTYFVDTLSVDLLHASQTALLPPLAGIVASAAAGAAADTLISRGVRVPTVRKIIQNIAFLLPTALLLAACTPEVADSSGATVAAITVSLGVSSFSLAGLFCTHQDLSPKYAPILLGLTNTTAAIPGVLGVASVGYLFEKTQSWECALFLPSAFFMVTAAAAYTFWGRNDPVDFDQADNSPFGFEAKYAAVKRALSNAFDFGLNPAPGSAVDWELPLPPPLADLADPVTTPLRKKNGKGDRNDKEAVGSKQEKGSKEAVASSSSSSGAGGKGVSGSDGRKVQPQKGRKWQEQVEDEPHGPAALVRRLRSLLGQRED